MKIKIETCDCTAIHEDIIIEVSAKMPSVSDIKRLTKLYQIFSDSTRARIMWALMHREMCVCDLAVLLDMTKSAVSHQLRVLREAYLVSSRREGKNVYYSLADNHVKDILIQGISHIQE
ncbi:transcriptional regulator [Anaerocolumna cellulosilytica]|uniref:Transcriptional regulator n=1 Tax=Anaerocolumna cellulosilytica TaxID=433286 RepID=A0A6S6RAE2_9FIRM|nr:metalloregulator ArsR/SmtB family transcription factor [Anaerocolumna cellulosilytica]MBB5195376.1 ArsR family transcriptional regulator [Anaerocolumna cellulosilytica]BCJ95908.1 transcriptional regulator [Anaerocolumna cellulosilytica]